MSAPFRVDPPVGAPQRVLFEGRWYRVRRVLDGWVAQSRWWAEEEERLYARIETSGPVVEAYRSDDGTWRLARVLD